MPNQTEFHLYKITFFTKDNKTLYERTFTEISIRQALLIAAELASPAVYKAEIEKD